MIVIALCLLAFVAGASAQCECPSMKWAICDGTPCKCGVSVDAGEKQDLDCTKLIPKCFLMKAEMFRVRNKMDVRGFGGKPVETALVDNDGLYDPMCEANGKFKAVQCNGTETCWCVNSAGVRRSDKGDKNIKCETAETYWVRLELVHEPLNSSVDVANLRTAIENTILERYNLDKKFVNAVDYDKNTRRIVVDVKKDVATDPGVDLAHMAYYMEKDIKGLTLFKSPKPTIKFTAASTNVPMEKIMVYYVDDKPPTFTMKALTGGVIAVIVVVVLAVVIGLLVLFFLRRREQAQYSKTQHREMAPMSS